MCHTGHAWAIWCLIRIADPAANLYREAYTHRAAPHYLLHIHGHWRWTVVHIEDIIDGNGSSASVIWISSDWQNAIALAGRDQEHVRRYGWVCAISNRIGDQVPEVLSFLTKPLMHYTNLLRDTATLSRGGSGDRASYLDSIWRVSRIGKRNYGRRHADSELCVERIRPAFVVDNFLAKRIGGAVVQNNFVVDDLCAHLPSLCSWVLRCWYLKRS